MKLFHFTGLRRLLGDEGFDAWSAALDEGDVPSALPYATPDSSEGGLKPFMTDDFDGALLEWLPWARRYDPLASRFHERKRLIMRPLVPTAFADIFILLSIAQIAQG